MFNYYCSNYGENLKADREGWWIAYDTESTDHGAIWVDPKYLVQTGSKILDSEQAHSILEKELGWEWDEGYFYASVNHYGYQSKEDL